MVTRRGWLLFLAMCLIWGIPYFLIKVAVGSFSPPTLVFARTLIAAILLVPIALARGYARVLIASWAPLLVYTAVEIGIPWVFLAGAEQHLSSSLAGLLVAAVPLIGAILAVATRSDDRLDRTRTVGLLMGFVGVAVLLGFNVAGFGLVPFLEIGVVVVAYAVGPLIIATWMKPLPQLGVIAASLLVVTVGYAPYALTHLPTHALPTGTLAAVAVLGVVCTALAFLVFFALISEVGPARSVVITYVNPAVAVALGALFLHERLNLVIGAGFILILAGSYLATRPVAQRRTAAIVQPEAR